MRRMQNHITVYCEGRNGCFSKTLPITKEEFETLKAKAGAECVVDYGASSDYYDDQDMIACRDVLNNYLYNRDFDEVNEFARVFTEFEREEHRALASVIEEGILFNLYCITLNDKGGVTYGMFLASIDLIQDCYGPEWKQHMSVGFKPASK